MKSKNKRDLDFFITIECGLLFSLLILNRFKQYALGRLKDNLFTIVYS